MASKRFELDEDFVGCFINGSALHTASGVWTFSGTGSEVVTLPASEADAPGIVNLATDTNINDTCRLIYGANTLIGCSFVTELSIRLRLTGTLSTQVVAGLFDTSNPLSVAVGRYLLYDTTGPDTYVSASANGGTDLVDSNLAGSPDFRTFTFRKNGVGALATYTVDDEDGARLFTGLHDANFPDTTQSFLCIQVKTLTAASRAVAIDRIVLKTEELVR